MNRKPHTGLLLAGALLVATAAPLEASPQRDGARATRPSSSSSSSSSGSVSRSSGSVSRSSGSQAVSRAPSSSPSRHGASATRPPSGVGGGVVERDERRGGGRVIFHPGFHHRYWHFGFGLGYPWGYYWGPYGYWGSYGYGPPYGHYPGYGGYPRVTRYQEPGAIDLNVKPKRAEVHVDGELVGSAGQFDGFPDYLWLTPGSHEVILYHDGYATQRRVVNIRPTWVLDLRIALEAGEALPPEQLSRPLEGDGQDNQAWRERDGTY